MIPDKKETEELARKTLNRQKEHSKEIGRILEARGHKSISELVERASKKGEELDKKDYRRESGQNHSYRDTEKNESPRGSFPRKKSLEERTKEVNRKAARESRKLRKKIDNVNSFEGYQPSNH